MSRRIESLEGLRFIMIILIVISHQDFLGSVSPINDFFPQYWSFQVLGVDFFFLLSGFGMMQSSCYKVQTGALHFSKVKENISFGINHVKKIYLLYIVTIVVGLGHNVIMDIINGKTFLSLFLNNTLKLAFVVPLLQSATGTMTFGHAFNGVGWFLSTLFCIYLISPWLIYLLRKYSKSFKSDVLCILVDMFFVVFLAYAFGLVENYSQQVGMLLQIDQLVYIGPYRRVFYVLTGMSIGLICYRYRDVMIKVFKKSNLWEVSCFVVAALWFLFRKDFPMLGIFRCAVDLLLCCAILVVFSMNLGYLSSLLSRKTMQKLGKMSMYIFLIHYPIKSIGSEIVDYVWGWTIASSLLFILFEFVLTFVLSIWLNRKNYC